MHKGGLSYRIRAFRVMHLFGTLVEAFLEKHLYDELKSKTLMGILGLGRTWAQNGRDYKKYP